MAIVSSVRFPPVANGAAISAPRRRQVGDAMGEVETEIRFIDEKLTGYGGIMAERMGLASNPL